MNYKIIRHISQIGEHNTLNLQFNEMQWYGGKPKYDLRKWEDGKPQKGFTLERDELEKLYIAIGRELGYDQSPKKDEEIHMEEKETKDKPEEPMDYRNFIVYGAYEDCVNKGHDYQDIIVVVPYYLSGVVKEVRLPARYCKTCKKYYISDLQYNTLVKKGRILCQVVSKKEYEEFSKELAFGELSTESILKIVGYTVNATDDFSDEYRQSVLKYSIAEGIFTKEKAIAHIGFLINLNEKKASMQEAIKKWKKDRAYLRGYDEKTPLFGVHKFFKD